MGNCWSCLKQVYSSFGTRRKQDYNPVSGRNDVCHLINDCESDYDRQDGGRELYHDHGPESELSQLQPAEVRRSRKGHRRRRCERMQRFSVEERPTNPVSETKIIKGRGINAKKVVFHAPSEFHFSTNDKSKPEPKRFRDIYQAMKTMLQLRYEKVLMPHLPWMRDYRLQLSKLYVKLTVHPCGTFGEKLAEKDIELRNIFDGSHRTGTRILVEGPPAYGKSTLALKLCQDWTNGEEYTKCFELAILIHLRNFTKQTFTEMLVDAVRIDWPNLKDEELKELILRNARSTLLVLDGYDELPTGKQQLLQPVLRGAILSEATVVVTARPGSHDHDAPLASIGSETTSYVQINSTTYFICVFQKRVEIKGLQEHQQSEFLHKHLSEVFSKTQIDELIASLATRYDRKLFECPLFLLLLAVLSIETNLASPKNSTDLYKNLFNFIVQRGLCCLQNFHGTVDLFTYSDDSVPYYIDLMKRFGKMALNSVVQRELTFSTERILHYFTNGDKRILKLGFLTQKESLYGIKHSSWFEPVHRTLIEFAAAYYLYLLLKQGAVEEFKCKFEELSEFLPDRHCQVDSPVLTFLSGLTEHQPSLLFDALKQFQSNDAYWFDSHYICLLSELETSEAVLTALSHFIPKDWPVNTERARIFCSSLLHKQLVEFGISNNLIQKIVWDVNSTANFPQNMNVPNIELQITERSNFSYRLGGENIHCTNLCCKLLGNEATTLKEENWADLVTLISTTQYQSISFDFNAFCSSLFLPMLVQETSRGGLKMVTFQRVKCVLELGKDCLLEQLLKLLDNVIVKELHIVLRSSPGVSQKLWNDFIQRLAQMQHVEELSVENTDCTSFVLIDESVLCNGGQKVWRSVLLEGYINLKFLDTNSRFQDVTYGAAGKTRYMRAILHHDVN